MNNLCIVVPYRDRSEHLAEFVPHMTAYFERDKFDHCIPYQILIVEQDGEDLFNLGMLRNIGFALARDKFDYFCFHDIDYLPIWTDYSYPLTPSRLIWYGAEVRPAKVGGRSFLKNDRDEFFGGVVLFRTEHFEAVNGYSNEYWGWGSEDTDLRARCEAEGLRIEHRDGTYRALLHDNRGVDEDLRRTLVAQHNLDLYRAKLPQILENAVHQSDGLSNLQYEVLDRKNVRHPFTDQVFPNVEFVTVKLPPRAEN